MNKKPQKRWIDPAENPNQIMPEFYYSAEQFRDQSGSDASWLTNIINLLNPDSRAKAAQQYSKTYKEVFDDEPINYKKENKARFAANTNIRSLAEQERVDKQSAIYTDNPPSWAIIAHLQIYPDDILFFEQYADQYTRFAIKAKPELILEIEEPSFSDLRAALKAKPQLILKYLDKGWFTEELAEIASMRDKSLSNAIQKALKES